jgi:hypothetical protein
MIQNIELQSTIKQIQKITKSINSEGAQLNFIIKNRLILSLSKLTPDDKKDDIFVYACTELLMALDDASNNGKTLQCIFNTEEPILIDTIIPKAIIESYNEEKNSTTNPGRSTRWSTRWSTRLSTTTDKNRNPSVFLCFFCRTRTGDNNPGPGQVRV